MSGRNVLAALLLSIAFGSLHAFASLLAPLERVLGTDRTTISLAYSLAIPALAVGVFGKGPLLRVFSPSTMTALVGLVAGSGVLLVTLFQHPEALWLGYGVLFGLANGVAYAHFITLARQGWSKAGGLAVGLVTAAYGGGAVLCSTILAFSLPRYGVLPTLQYQALVILAAALVAAFLQRQSQAASDSSPVSSPGQRDWRQMGWFWSIYCLAATGGLMVIAHSQAIMVWAGTGPTMAASAVPLNAFGNIAGSLIGGAFADRLPVRVSMLLPVGCGLIAIFMLLMAMDDNVLLTAMMLAGIGYGALISVVPVALARLAGPAGFAAQFPAVFTAWGVAGALGPLLAGFAFDKTASYTTSLMLAAGFAGLALCIGLMPLSASRWKASIQPAKPSRINRDNRD